MRKMFKKIVAIGLFLSVLMTCIPVQPFGMDVWAASDVTEYSYEISAVLESFNEWFFVKTDNPDPTSFRFVDKQSVLCEESVRNGGEILIAFEDYYSNFADVVYDDEETQRVNGGYLFIDSYAETDGGEIVLQINTSSTWQENWVDTDVVLTLPSLTDTCGYLVDTYATEDNFFDNMTAVQNGFRSISQYSGSYVKGKIVDDEDVNDWYVSAYGHADQSFYILSPYYREDNVKLFASFVYPFIADSLGFPSVMGQVSQRLDSESSYVWDDYSHHTINVTYKGETRDYGGAGEGAGQGIPSNKIIKYFAFEDSDDITLQGLRQLLVEYAGIEVDDDTPRENELDWEEIYNKIGNGSWVKVKGGFSYLYPYPTDEFYFYSTEYDLGKKLYWHGSLGYCSDTWHDGRYISIDECYVPGAVFEDYPESGITLANIKVPHITSFSSNFTSANFVEKEHSHMRYGYDEANEVWIADDFHLGYDGLAALVENGVLDESYLDTLVLTKEEVAAMDIDHNTNILPSQGYIYDGFFERGTPFTYENGIIYADNWVVDCDNTCPSNLVFPNSIKGIMPEAFRDCDSLVSITIPDSVTSIDQSTFSGCGSLTNVIIPPTVTSIGVETFYGCGSLKSVTIPDGITSISQNTFWGCSSLTSVTIPSSVTSISYYAFKDCTSLTDIYYDGTIEEWQRVYKSPGNDPLQYAAVHCKDGGINTTTTTTTTTTMKPTTSSTTKTTTTTQKPTTTTTAKPTTTSTTASTTTIAKPTTTSTTTTKRSITTTVNPTTTTSTTTTTAKATTAKPTTSTIKATTTAKPTTTTTTRPMAAEGVVRIAGGSRTQTAVAISKKAFSKTTTVILADGNGYADSLAGAPLAYALDAPILLVRNSNLDADTKAEISRLGAKKVIILGGELAINNVVVTTLRNMGITVERIAGKSRFDTAVEIAKKLEQVTGEKPDEVFFAYSHNYADALSVGGIAAVKNTPILYIAQNGVLSDSTKGYVQSSGAKTAYILGGKLAISDDAIGNIKKAGASTVERVSGPSRYATCIAINERFEDILTGSSICVATGTNFPDALAGGVLAAKNGGPLVLVPQTLTDVQTDYIKDFDPANIYIFGGEFAVSKDIETQFKNYI